MTGCVRVEEHRVAQGYVRKKRDLAVPFAVIKRDLNSVARRLHSGFQPITLTLEVILLISNKTAYVLYSF